MVEGCGDLSRGLSLDPGRASVSLGTEEREKKEFGRIKTFVQGDPLDWRTEVLTWPGPP